MVKKEKLIKFPVPDWNRMINSDLDSIAYCVCYQYNIDSNGFGPYGFNTDNAEKIIKKSFSNLMYLENNNDRFLLKYVENIQQSGIYLYGEKENLDLVYAELIKYYLEKKKNEIKLKKLLPQTSLPSKPLLLNLIDNDKYKSEVITKMLYSGCKIIICHHYMPEAWQTLILFDQDILSKLKKYTSYYRVQFVEVSSIDKLKAW